MAAAERARWIGASAGSSADAAAAGDDYFGSGRARSGSGTEHRNLAALPQPVAARTDVPAASAAAPQPAVPLVELALVTVNNVDLRATMHEGTIVQLSLVDIALARAPVHATISDGTLHKGGASGNAHADAPVLHLFADQLRMAAEPNCIMTCTAVHVPLVPRPLHASQTMSNLCVRRRAALHACARVPPPDMHIPDRWAHVRPVSRSRACRLAPSARSPTSTCASRPCTRRSPAILPPSASWSPCSTRSSRWSSSSASSTVRDQGKPGTGAG